MKQAPGAIVAASLYCFVPFLLHCSLLLSFFCSSEDSLMGHILFREEPAPVQVPHTVPAQMWPAPPWSMSFSYGLVVPPLFHLFHYPLCFLPFLKCVLTEAPQIPLIYFSFGMQWIHSWAGLNCPCLAQGSLWPPPREAIPAGPLLAKCCHQYRAHNVISKLKIPACKEVKLLGRGSAVLLFIWQEMSPKDMGKEYLVYCICDQNKSIIFICLHSTRSYGLIPDLKHPKLKR